MLTGNDVYKSLMDLDLILQDADEMVPLMMFLLTIDCDTPALIKLNDQITSLTNVVSRLVVAAKGMSR